ncbi:DUF6266 family protein [Epilithonimonas mollis]|uniref:Uncharacterized protein n=1 Tax=Epilithonimonas mollis TaxID=216903 RepID=A0A1M6MZC6_9FLAO|nr:DUF6266 family protein [Epilithonimonas mollis]SHJ88764.1 hypothetical protein SAMN05444371_0066 [Epilithonimonas mollis]
MGKVTDSILGGTTGRTGRVVIANVFGTEISRIRPKKNDKPATPKQALVKERMRLAALFISSYKAFASQYFGERSGLRSRYNQAMTNIMNAYHIDFTTFSIDRANEEIIFSKGDLPEVTLSSLISTTASTFTVTWEDNSDGTDALATDEVYILYCAEDENRPKLLRHIATRTDGATTVTLLNKYTGKTIHVWLCLVKADGTKVSISDYAGNVVIS